MSMINEDLARRSKENMSFSDYKPGSATAEYNQEINRITALVEQAKSKVSDKGKEKLDRFLESYKARYANWVNARNRNGAGHVSVMIAGPANYNMKQHERYLSREGKLWQEYEEYFQHPEYKIQSIVAGDKIIKSGDSDAIEKLQAKIKSLEESQELMKAVNVIIRKKNLTKEEKIQGIIALGLKEKIAREVVEPNCMGHIGFASYSLQNNNANIRTAKRRLEKLQKDRAQGSKEIVIESENPDTEGIRIVDNIESARLQIFFPDKPNAEVRAQLKKNGFRWTPSIGAWQSYRSERANNAAREIVNNY